MSETELQRLSSILNELHELLSSYVLFIARFDDKIRVIENSRDASELEQDSNYWVTVVYRNALIRLRLILENNFLTLETLGVLATTRYVFETLVWLRKMEREPNYSLVFYGKVIGDQLQQRKDYKAKVEAEIAVFEKFQKEENSLHEDALKQMKDHGSNVSAEHVSGATAFVMNEMDRRSRRAFSLYAKDAKQNGFGFQAHLLREQAIPQIDAQIDELVREKAKFTGGSAPPVRKKVEERWNWKAEAMSVGMQAQYEFIYSHTSRLLHATPSSILTDQKNLEVQEMAMFLDYVYVSLLDVLDLAGRQVGPVGKTH